MSLTRALAVPAVMGRAALHKACVERAQGPRGQQVCRLPGARHMAQLLSLPSQPHTLVVTAPHGLERVGVADVAALPVLAVPCYSGLRPPLASLLWIAAERDDSRLALLICIARLHSAQQRCGATACGGSLCTLGALCAHWMSTQREWGRCLHVARHAPPAVHALPRPCDTARAPPPCHLLQHRVQRVLGEQVPSFACAPRPASGSSSLQPQQRWLLCVGGAGHWRTGGSPPCPAD